MHRESSGGFPLKKSAWKSACDDLCALCAALLRSLMCADSSPSWALVGSSAGPALPPFLPAAPSLSSSSSSSYHQSGGVAADCRAASSCLWTTRSAYLLMGEVKCV